MAAALQENILQGGKYLYHSVPNELLQGRPDIKGKSLE